MRLLHPVLDRGKALGGRIFLAAAHRRRRRHDRDAFELGHAINCTRLGWWRCLRTRLAAGPGLYGNCAKIHSTSLRRLPAGISIDGMVLGPQVPLLPFRMLDDSSSRALLSLAYFLA